MTIRRTAALSTMLLAAASCTPSIPNTPSPASVVSAIFDPTNGDIPLPSNLLFQDIDALPVAAAEKELLHLFLSQGGFPSDQEVAVTISLAEDQINADGSTTRVAPALDPASFTAQNTLVLRLNANGTVSEIPLDPVQASDLVAAPATVGPGQVTVLSLHHQGRTPWEPGTYVALLRGGAAGPKTTTGDDLWASSVFFLVAQGADMTSQANLVLLQAQAGSYEAALALGQQLNALGVAFQPAFAACDTRFPHQELAVMTAFSIGAKHTVVELDPGRGLVPLPIDLLRDPRPASSTCAACGKLTPLAACTLAQGTFDAAAGTCSSPASAGFAALDGFSTTAPLLAPTSDLVTASTVTSTTYRLYDLTNPAAPVLVDPATYLTEPAEFTSTGFSPVVASQPVGATAADATSPFRSKPLKDNTSYAVLITTGVKDKAGNPLARGTIGSILLFTNPLSVNGKSQLAGVDDASAYGLEAMRLQLQPVVAAAAAGTSPVTTAQIAMTYTFKTQTITSEAVQLGALPYTMAATTGAPGAVTAMTAAQAFAKYGVATSAVAGGNVLVSSNIQEVLEADITTFNLLDPLTGAFNPAAPPQAETIHVLIAVPKVTSPAPACAGAMAPFGKCAPLMVFRHGLGGGRADMLTVADTYAARGLVTVAIDAAKHGDRAYCTGGQATYTLPGVGPVPQCGVGTCVAVPGFTTQGDTTIPGRCTVTTNGDGVPVRRNVMSSATCAVPGGCGIPVFSSNYLVSANFFRTRDTLRQDIIDQSQLIRAIAFAPSGAPPTGHTVFDHMVAGGLVIDPATVYFSGQSLGAIQGTVDVASNPRITKAVLNVGGGTLVDIFTTSPAFVDGINAMLAALGIQPGTSAYLQFLAVAKLILDPADPINFAGHLTASTLPNLLPPLGGNPDGSVPQAAKKLLTQAALCDGVVPNTWNYVLASNAGTSPLPGAPTFGVPGTFQLFFKMVGAPPTPAEVSAAITACGSPSGTSPNAVSHGFLTNWSDTLMTTQGQSDAAAFVVSDTLPPSLVVLP